MMNQRLNKIVTENMNEYDSWVEILNIHKDSILNSESLNEIKAVPYAAADVLEKISNLAIRYGNFKDEFDTGNMYLDLYGPSLIIKSIKTDGIFYLSTDRDGINLRTSLLQAENIKNMSDDFWNELFELKNFKGFVYQENTSFPIDVQRKYPELFHSYKDSLFLIFRNFFLSHTEGYNDIDIGDFIVKWKTSQDFKEIIEQICIAFKSMYKMNYQLWKITDLRNKKNVDNKVSK